MIKVLRTNSKNQNFIDLVALLDTELAIRDRENHAFYNQFNKIDQLKHVVILFDNELPIACGAIKVFESEVMEVKRMYTKPEGRGKGIASQVLTELEKWASQLSYKKCILETGFKQPEAIALYKKNGYRKIPNYGQYTGIENSLCFEKKLDMFDIE